MATILCKKKKWVSSLINKKEQELLGNYHLDNWTFQESHDWVHKEAGYRLSFYGNLTFLSNLDKNPSRTTK